jgi:predicted nucleotidyltransferase
VALVTQLIVINLKKNGATMLFRKVYLIAFLATVILVTGCTKVHKVKLEKIDPSETYRIGVIKVAGVMPIPVGNHIEKKVQALQNIQYEEICQIIEHAYNIKINKTIKDKTPKFLVEYEFNNPVTNAYFGNDEYVQKSPVAIGSLFNYYRRENVNNQSHIDIIYRFATEKSLLSFPTERFYYEIIVNKDEEDIIVHKGLIGAAPIPMRGPFNIITDLDGLWDAIIASAKNIDEVLLSDINEQKN